MSSQMTVIIAGIVLVVAIVVALVIMRRGDSRLPTTRSMERPRAPLRARAIPPRPPSRVASPSSPPAWGAMFAALASSCGACRWSRRTTTTSRPRATRPVPSPRRLCAGESLIAMAWHFVQNRPSLAVVAYRDLADDTVLVHHLANVLGMPYVAVLRNIQDNSEGAQSLHTIATDVRRSTVAYIKEHAGEFPGVKIAERTERQYPYGETACHILGYTGTITSEQLEAQNKKASGDNDSAAGQITYQSGDIVGQAGVESYYENLLQGIRRRADGEGRCLGQCDRSGRRRAREGRFRH